MVKLFKVDRLHGDKSTAGLEWSLMIQYYIILSNKNMIEPPLQSDHSEMCKGLEIHFNHQKTLEITLETYAF